MAAYPLDTLILIQFSGLGDSDNAVYASDVLYSRGYKPYIAQNIILPQGYAVYIIVGGQDANPVFADAVSKGWVRAITQADDDNAVLQGHSEAGIDYYFAASWSSAGTRKAIDDLLSYPFFNPLTGVDVRVLDCDTNQPVSGATVEFTDGVIIYRKATDAQGFALFTELPPNTTFTMKVYKVTYDGLQESFTTPSQGSYVYKQVNLCKQRLGNVYWSFTTRSIGDWVQVLGPDCRYDGLCAIVIYYPYGAGATIHYWYNENPYIWYFFNGIPQGQITSNTTINIPIPGTLFEIKGLTQLPTYKRIEVTVKNNGDEHKFGLNLQIFQIISPILTGCDTTGSGLIAQTDKTYFTLAPNEVRTLDFSMPIPSQYTHAYVVAKVWDNGNCLDGDFAYF